MMTYPPMLRWGGSRIRGELYAEPEALPRVNNDFAKPQAGVGWKAWEECERAVPSSRVPHYFDPTTCRLLSTEKVPGTVFARIFARSLSLWLSTTPSSVTCPFLTMIRMGFC